MKALSLLLFSASLACAQKGSAWFEPAPGLADTITATASRNLNLPPDLAAFDVLVSADPATSQDQIVQSLQGAGISAQNLITVSSTTDCSGNPQLSYEFAFTVPYGKVKDTTDKLEAIRKNQSLSYSVAASASDSAIEAARQSIIPELAAEAKKTAEKKAQQAKVELGKLVAASDSPGSNAGSLYLLSGRIVPATRIGACYSTSTSTTSVQNISITFQVYLSFNVHPRSGRERIAR